MGTREENIADFLLGACIGVLAEFYEGLENVPAELLNRSQEANLGYAKVITEMFEHRLDDPLDDVMAVGVKGIRDPEFPCEQFNPGKPNGNCDSDGHYMCLECSERKAEEEPDEDG